MVDGITEPGQAGANGASGFGLLDEKGRISLPKPVRNALGVHPGSSMAYLVLDHALLLIPQDAHLEELMQRGREALTQAGLSVQDLLDELPAARNEVMVETYGAVFLEELERLRQEMQTQEMQTEE